MKINSLFVFFCIFNSQVFANECKDFLAPITSGLALNSDDIFRTLMDAPLNLPQEHWIFLDANYGTQSVTQYGARIVPSLMGEPISTVYELIQSASKDPSNISRGLRLANLDPDRLNRYFELNPDSGETLKSVFGRGIEVAYVVLTTVKGEQFFKYISTYLPDSVDFNFLEMKAIDKFIEEVELGLKEDQIIKLDVYHNHPEPQPLSPEDVAFIRSLAFRKGFFSEIFAFAEKGGSVFIFGSVLAKGGRVEISD